LKVYRLTLTLPVINTAAQVTFLVSGQSKTAIVNDILGSKSDAFTYPAAKVSPIDGRLTWLVTADTIGNLQIR
jgi:6-phosphogluconolactonase